MAESWRQALGTHRLLVSGFGKWGGGIYDLTSGQPVALDDLPTSGIAIGGDRFWRVLRAPGEQTASCELLSYDDRGVRSYERFDAIRDPHDVCWHDGAIHVSASWDSVVWRVEPDGELRSVWRGGTVPDSWHLNSLVVVDGRLHVCAFGRFDDYKGWKLDQGKKAGFVHDVDRGVDVLTGLSHPHNPQRLGEHWYLCESTNGSLIECDGHGRVQRRALVRRFSRGLTVMGNWAFVGGNARRGDDDDRADVSVVDLASFGIVERIAVPCLEIYDILPVPWPLARGVALGFGANPARSVEQHRGHSREAERRPTPETARVGLVNPRVAAKLAIPGQALDADSAARCRVIADLPKQVPAGSVQLLPVVVENRSKLALATVVPEPIRVSARWLPLDDGDNGTDDGTVRNPFSPLPRLLHPGDRAEIELVLTAPERPGRYEVRIALHQPSNGWFGRRAQADVIVTDEPAPVLRVMARKTGAGSEGRGQPRGRRPGRRTAVCRSRCAG